MFTCLNARIRYISQSHHTSSHTITAQFLQQIQIILAGIGVVGDHLHYQGFAVNHRLRPVAEPGGRVEHGNQLATGELKQLERSLLSNPLQTTAAQVDNPLRLWLVPGWHCRHYLLEDRLSYPSKRHAADRIELTR
ncbi:hypothetical protein D3C85_1334810 [compost metagenome]